MTFSPGDVVIVAGQSVGIITDAVPIASHIHRGTFRYECRIWNPSDRSWISLMYNQYLIIRIGSVADL